VIRERNWLAAVSTPLKDTCEESLSLKVTVLVPIFQWFAELIVSFLPPLSRTTTKSTVPERDEYCERSAVNLHVIVVSSDLPPAASTSHEAIDFPLLVMSK
jgi:hypothetical protein